jgi:5-oxoprolinase (ATP-hydrolysing) subunit A
MAVSGSVAPLRIDLNADVGESFGRYVLGQDTALMPLITSANVACGFHAGDPHVMRKTVQSAIAHGVAIGAHPGFPDLAGFGRRPIPLTPAEVEDIVVYQVGALSGMVRACGGGLRHVKPHGALYNVAADNLAIAEAIARATAAIDPGLILVGLAGSASIAAARTAGLATAGEAFADRTYESDGRLSPRERADAVIHDADQAAARAVFIVMNRAVPTRDGGNLPIDVDTICIHGDTPGAAALARAVREALTRAGVEVAAPR